MNLSKSFAQAENVIRVQNNEQPFINVINK